MKSNLLTLLAGTASVCVTISLAAPTVGESLADGLWLFAVDDTGKTVADVTSRKEFYNTTVPLKVRNVQPEVSYSLLAKRGSGCRPTARIPDAQTGEANRHLLEQFPGPTVTLGRRQKASVCVLLPGTERAQTNCDRATSMSTKLQFPFLCSEGATKPKTAISGT